MRDKWQTLQAHEYPGTYYDSIRVNKDPEKRITHQVFLCYLCHLHYEKKSPKMIRNVKSLLLRLQLKMGKTKEITE